MNQKKKKNDKAFDVEMLALENNKYFHK